MAGSTVKSLLKRVPLAKRLSQRLPWYTNVSFWFKHPYFLFLDINKLCYRLTARLRGSTDGFIFDEEWDNLVILDSCRFDTFQEMNTLPGTLESRHSGAGATMEFLREHFAGRDLRDTVYVTANPQFHRLRDELGTQFHDVVEMWADEEQMHPERVTDTALEAAESYPNKRLIVHYNQPHIPFLGETSEKYDLNDRPENGDLPIWHHAMMGDVAVSRETLERSYEETLAVALPHVERLLSDLRGKTVVTADHGQMFGERIQPIPIRVDGHHTGIHSEELVKVPWLVHEKGEKRTIDAEAETESSIGQEANADVEERLRDLGYRT